MPPAIKKKRMQVIGHRSPKEGQFEDAEIFDVDNDDKEEIKDEDSADD